MTTTLRFVPPAARINANDRHHHHERAALTRAWRETAGWAALAQLAGPERAHRRSTVRVFFPVRDRRRRDPSNWMPTVKAIIDGLVDSGLWPDDNPEWVEVLEPRFHVAHDEVVVTVEETDEPAPSMWPTEADREAGRAAIAHIRETLKGRI